MKLAELSFACYVYSNMTGYDKSYTRFLDATTRPRFDLDQPQHQKALLKWLNAWGCRQFALAHHKLAAKEIWEWFRASDPKMFSTDLTLLSLSDKDLMVVEQAFDQLAARTASLKRRKKGREYPVEIGPTGASKILFALRPLSLIPWDDAIRKQFKSDGSGRSYVDYLRRAKDDLRELEQDCERNGYKLADLPSLLGRPNPSLVKLVGEYYWVTVSGDCPFPSERDIKLWTTVVATQS